MMGELWQRHLARYIKPPFWWTAASATFNGAYWRLPRGSPGYAVLATLAVASAALAIALYARQVDRQPVGRSRTMRRLDALILLTDVLIVVLVVIEAGGWRTQWGWDR